MSNLMQRAAQLTALRERAGLRKVDLARALGVNCERVCYLESGRWGTGGLQPSLDLLRRLAAILGEEVWAIWGYDSPETARAKMARLGIEV